MTASGRKAVCAAATGSSTSHGCRCQWCGPELETHAPDQPKRAERPDHEAGQVVAGDVLDDLGATAHHAPIAGGDHDFERPVPGRTVAKPAPTGQARRQHATNGGVARRLRQDRGLAALGQQIFERRNTHPGLDHHREVLVLPVDHGLQVAGRQDDVGVHRIADALMASTPPRPDHESTSGRRRQHRRRLLNRWRSDHKGGSRHAGFGRDRHRLEQLASLGVDAAHGRPPSRSNCMPKS